MDILLGVLIIILLALLVVEHPFFFRYRSLRFVYRAGLLLYSRTFKVHAQTNKLVVPRWKFEHWMAASGFSSKLSAPMAEEDGEGRFIFTEFAYLLGSPYPLLMRGKISWDNKEKNVVVRGYATWWYFLFLAFLVGAFFIPPKVEGNLCVGVLSFAYLLWCAIVYVYQVPHFHSIGEKVADFLSSDQELVNQ